MQQAKTLRKPLLTLGLILHGAHCLAQPDDTLPEVVISALPLARTETAVNQHVQVFTREQIDAHPAASVGEFLLRRAGIPVDRSGRNAGYGSLYLRGADPSHVVVLIDGVRQNDPLSSRGSAVDLNSLSLDDIERIEVIRGNTSVAHAEAMAGVVALFTAGARGPFARVRGEAGGGGARALAGSVGSPSLRLSAAHREDGQGATGAVRIDAVNLGHRAQFANGSVQLDARLVEGAYRGFPDDSGGQRFAVNRALESNRFRTRQLSGRLLHDLGTSGALEFGLHHFGRDGRQDAPAVAPGLRDPSGLPRLRADSDYERLAGHIHWLTQAMDWSIVTGLQWQRERGALDSVIDFGRLIPASFHLSRSTSSLFAEAHRSTGPWRYHLGLRTEATPGEGTRVHPAAAVQLELPGGRDRVGAGISSASKLPSFFALGHPLVGNPALTRESTRQVEAYWASDAPDGSHWRITAFQARYLDLVDFDPGPPPRLVNRGTIDVRGIEWSWHEVLDKRWVARTQGTIMDLGRPPGAEPLRYRPRQQWLVGLDARLAARWHAAADLVHVGRRHDSSIPTAGRTLEAYSLLQLSLARDAGPWSFYGVIDNALGSSADEVIGTRLAGRRLRVGVRYAMERAP